MNDRGAAQCHKCHAPLLEPSTDSAAEHAVEVPPAPAAEHDVEVPAPPAAEHDVEVSTPSAAERHVELATPPAAAVEPFAQTPALEARWPPRDGDVRPSPGPADEAPGEGFEAPPVAESFRCRLVGNDAIERAWLAKEPDGTAAAHRERDGPYMGPLTAPIDEAELPTPDLEPSRRRGLRRAALFSIGVALLLIPGLVALSVLEPERSEVLARTAAWVRAALVQATPVVSAVNQTAAPQPTPDSALATAAPSTAPVADTRAAVAEHAVGPAERALDRDAAARSPGSSTTAATPPAHTAPEAAKPVASPTRASNAGRSTSTSWRDASNTPLKSPSIASLGWTRPKPADATVESRARRKEAPAERHAARASLPAQSTDPGVSAAAVPAAEPVEPPRSRAEHASPAPASSRCTPALAALALCESPRVEAR